VRLHSFLRLAFVLVLPLLAAGARADGILGSDLSTFAVLGSSAVVNVPPSVITGDVGVWSAGGANSITGFTSPTDSQVTGAVEPGTPSAMAAQSQLTTAITNLGGLASVETPLTGDLGGLNLSPGVYSFATSAQLTGTLNLVNPTNIADASWVFLIGTSLTTATGSVVNVDDPGGSDEGVFWDVGTSASLGTDTSFEGNILADASITLITGATDSCGRLLASTGAVTLGMNTVSTGCTSKDTEGGSEGSGTNGYSGGLTVTTTPNGGTVITGGGIPGSTGGTGGTGGTQAPEPGTLVLLLAGLGGLLVLRKVWGASSGADCA
jgi:Ice-binding-like